MILSGIDTTHTLTYTMHMLSCLAILMHLPVLRDMWSLIFSGCYLLQICLDILTLNLPLHFSFLASSVYSSRSVGVIHSLVDPRPPVLQFVSLWMNLTL